ncbi:MAG: hypothetical protein ABW179_01030 [Methylobacterium sp.]
MSAGNPAAIARLIDGGTILEEGFALPNAHPEVAGVTDPVEAMSVVECTGRISPRNAGTSGNGRGARGTASAAGARMPVAAS